MGSAGNSLTITESQMVKGIAILFMIFHHLFNKAAVYEEFQLTGLIINQDINLTIANDLKVCVAMFAFLSGYGMTEKRKAVEGELTLKQHSCNVGRQYFNLIKDTVFLLPILVVFTLLFGFSRTPVLVWGGKDGNDVWRQIGGIVTNMTGTASFFRLVWFVRSWWYLKVAILFILLFPFLYAFRERYGSVLLLLFAMIGLPYLLQLKISHDNLWRYLPAFVTGMTMADYDFVGKVKKCATKTRIRYILTGFLLLFSIVTTVVLKHLYGYSYIIQSFQAALIVLVTDLYIRHIPGINRSLEIIGRNSKYIWLLHVYIYGQVMYYALYSFRNIWLIWFAVLMLSLLTSIMLKKAQFATMSFVSRKLRSLIKA